MADKVNKRIVGLERVKARAALRVRQRFAQQEQEAELKRLEDEAMKKPQAAEVDEDAPKPAKAPAKAPTKKEGK